MRWLVVLGLLAGTRLGALAVGPHTLTPVQIAIPAVRVVDPPPRPASVPAAPPPSVAAHSIACGDPKRLGTPVAKLDTEVRPAHLPWRVVAAKHACVIAAWTENELVASYDDGATFTPVVVAGKIQSVALGDTGTLYVLADSVLEVRRPDGTVVRRPLMFGDEGVLEVRGNWLWLSHFFVGDQPSLSPDDGASWIHLAWTEGDLVDITVLDGGIVVGLGDYHGQMCDHFGCGDGPFTAAFETTVAGGPWKPATPAHARTVRAATAIVDSHGFELTRDNDSRYIVRVVGHQARALYRPRAS